MTDTQQQPAFGIDKIYIKDCSLENPNAPSIFRQREESKVDLAFEPTHQKINDDYYEIAVRVTITAKMKSDGKTVFICEVTQAGIFLIQNLSGDDLDAILTVNGPNILFPYLRQTVTMLTNGAGFPPVVLPPFNFEAYQRNEATESGNTIQ